MVVGILSFISIVIVLRTYENQLLSRWTLPISINAIVAILTALFKGSLALPVTEGDLANKKRLWGRLDANQ